MRATEQPAATPLVGLAQRSYEPDAKGPLAGVRVLDLTRLVSGAQLGLILGDLGADVVKVERPGSGDPFRHTTVDGYDAYWKAYGRNKRSVTLDLASERGRELVFRLAENADVLAENFSPGVLERVCGGPEGLLERNPKLVILRISGWGQTGPRASQPGFGTLAEAYSGFTFLNGPADGPPVQAPLSLADTVAGTYAAAATLAALWSVRVNGAPGQVVDISLYEPLFSILGADATVYAGRGHLRGRGDGAGVSSVRGVFQTSDDHWVAISAATDETAARFFAAIERDDLLADPRFDSAEARLAHRDELHEALVPEFRRFRREEILALAAEHRLTIGPVLDVLDALADEHYRARETIVEMEDGVVLHNVVPRLSGTPGAIRLPAPELGEHNAAVYGELGIDSDELARLAADGVV
ncbi:MAG TPA: CaiB/BaiF CoA-transferase family protein [Gaiellaceae bacterium]|nr:CaiB/BaiF CoA-transferase family protein [Gaiellaceae bacterium]